MKWLLIYALIKGSSHSIDTGIIRVENLQECQTAAHILKHQGKRLGAYRFEYKCVHSSN